MDESVLLEHHRAALEEYLSRAEHAEAAPGTPGADEGGTDVESAYSAPPWPGELPELARPPSEGAGAAGVAGRRAAVAEHRLCVTVSVLVYWVAVSLVPVWNKRVMHASRFPYAIATAMIQVRRRRGPAAAARATRAPLTHAPPPLLASPPLLPSWARWRRCSSWARWCSTTGWTTCCRTRCSAGAGAAARRRRPTPLRPRSGCCRPRLHLPSRPRPSSTTRARRQPCAGRPRPRTRTCRYSRRSPRCTSLAACRAADARASARARSRPRRCRPSTLARLCAARGCSARTWATS